MHKQRREANTEFSKGEGEAAHKIKLIKADEP